MKLQVIGQMIAFTERETLVSGTVNKYRAEFEFDDSWDGYTKTAVFRADSFGHITSREVLLAGDACQVPHECLIAGGLLRVGVYGISGDITTPTIYTQEPIGVARGAEPAESTQDPTPGVYQQIINMIEGGSFAGPPGPQGPQGEQGPAGVGVPSGGTAGQVLSKTEDGTAWTDPPSVGVTSWNDLRDKPFYDNGEAVKTIDEKFIPETIAKKSDIPEVDTSVLMTVDGDQAVYGNFVQYKKIQGGFQLRKTAQTNLYPNVYIGYDGSDLQCVKIYSTASLLSAVLRRNSDGSGGLYVYSGNNNQTLLQLLSSGIKIKASGKEANIRCDADGFLFGAGVASSPYAYGAARLKNIAVPVNDTDAVNKHYVDAKISDTDIILSSSTEGSTKKFRITVDDTGAISATEVT